KNDVKRSSVSRKWHVFDWQYAGNHTLVSMTTTEFVTDANLAHLSNKNLDLHKHAGLQFVTVLAAKNLHANNFAVLTVTHPLRCVTHLFCLFTKDGSKQALFAAQFLLALRGNF